MSAAIETRGLTRFFGEFCAVDHIDIKVDRGVSYGFLGPNGAGKSTTIKMLTGLLAPSSGAISVLGRDVSKPDQSLEAKQHIGVVPEDLALFDNLTGREYLTFVGRMYRVPQATLRSRVDDLLGLMALDEEEKKLTLEYSHGMKKKLALAAALLPNPDLLFLDEPFEGVDAVTSKIIRDMLTRFVSRGSTVFITSHVLEIVEKLCTHVGIIAHGKLVEQASLDELRRGSSLESRFLEKVGSDAGATQKLAWLEEERAVIAEHFRAIVWLRWRLFRNRLTRSGIVNKVLTGIVLCAILVTSVSMFFVALAVGIRLLPQAKPEYVLYAWTALIVGFLFFWLVGLMTELQRSDPVSLEKLLHFPISLGGAFVVNYLSSFVSVTMVVFLPAMIGLSIASVVAIGPAMLIILPSIAGFILAVTAVTYHFQGWLASLMVNKRRRRTLVACITAAFILISQAPNLLNLTLWRNQREQIRATMHDKQQELERLQHLHDQFMKGEISADQLRAQMEAANKRLPEKGWAESGRVATWVRIADMVIPPGWPAYGAMAAMGHNVWPGLLGTVGLCLIAGASLRRSYRTTLRFYRGEYQAAPAAKHKPKPKAVVRSKQGRSASLLEKRLPGVPEPAAAIALATLQSLLRAPEVKMMLLTSMTIGLTFGLSLLAGRGLQMPPPIRPFIALGFVVMEVATLIQFFHNQFGFDRSGFRVFVLSPSPRRDILLGKNLAFVPLVMGIGVIAIAILQVMSPLRMSHLLASVVQLAGAFLIISMTGNQVSILFPTAVRAGSMKTSKSATVTVLAHFVAGVLALLAFVPLFIPLGIELLWDWRWPGSRVPVDLCLSLLELALLVVLYRIVLNYQGELLQSREQRILETVTTKDD